MSTTTDDGGARPTWWRRRLDAQHRRQLRFAERTAHRLPRWRTRRRRRAVVAATVAGLVLMLAGAGLSFTGLGTTLTSVLFAVAWVGGVALSLGSWFTLRVLTSNVADLPAAVLDEREAAQRAEVRSAAMYVLLLAALVPMLLLILVSRAGEPSAIAYPAGLLLAVAILLGGFTPAALLAWDAPDPDPEDLDDDVHETTEGAR